MKSSTLYKIGIALLVLCLGAGFIFWFPELKNFLELKEQSRLLDDAVIKKEEYILELKSISQKLKKYNEAFQKIDFALSSDPEIDSLLLMKFMPKISSENGLFLSSLSIDASSLKFSKQIEDFSFSLNLKGSYPALKNMLSAFYYNARLFEIDALNFSSDSENKNIFDFNIEARTHYYSPSFLEENRREKEELENNKK